MSIEKCCTAPMQSHRRRDGRATVPESGLDLKLTTPRDRRRGRCGREPEQRSPPATARVSSAR